MKKENWTESEDKLLLKLRQKNTPYKEIIELIPNKSQDACRNRFYILNKENNNTWLKEERIAFLDIESSGFNANFDYMLSWAIKYLDGETKSDVISKKDINSLNFDKRITASLIKELEQADVIVTYYGSKFDIPFMRTRALMLNLDFPTYGSIKHIDIYYAVKFGLKLARNTLEQATTALGIEGKNHVLGKEWIQGRVGDKASLEYILDHNIKDVEILEGLYKRLLPYKKFTRKSI